MLCKKVGLIVILVLFQSTQVISQQTRSAAVNIANMYLSMEWTAGDDGFYDGNQIFWEGIEYTGMAYWYGGWDTIAEFLDKMDNGYAPREEAGIDCSGLVSRCWDLSTKKSVWHIMNDTNLAKQTSREYSQDADVFAKTGHTLIITNFEGRSENDDVNTIAATGGMISQVIDDIQTWNYYDLNGYNIYCYHLWWDVGVPDPAMTWGDNNSPLNSITSGACQVTLSWDMAPGHNDDTRYKVFWGTSPGIYTNNTSQIEWVANYTVDNLEPYQTYYFAVKVGRDPAGTYGWSDFSNELYETPYATSWIVSGNVTISSDVSVYGDLFIQNGGTLNIAPSTTLTFATSQQGTNYGGDASRCEIVVEYGGTLSLGAGAKLTSSGTWGGVYQLADVSGDGGHIELGGGSIIENARFGIFMNGHDTITTDSGNYAKIRNCTVDGIRVYDCSANIHYIDIENCLYGMQVMGASATPLIYNVTIHGSSTINGLRTNSWAVPRLRYSEVNNDLSGNCVQVYEYGDLDIAGECNNLYDDASSYALYISSNSSSMSIAENYWGSSSPVLSNICNDPSKITGNPFTYSSTSYPYAGKSTPGNSLRDDLIAEAVQHEIDDEYEKAYTCYHSALELTDNPGKRLNIIKILYNISSRAHIASHEVRTLVEDEKNKSEGMLTDQLVYLLGNMALRENNMGTAITVFETLGATSDNDVFRVESMVKLAMIHGHLLDDKEKARTFADMAAGMRPEQESLVSAYAASGVTYEPWLYRIEDFEQENFNDTTTPDPADLPSTGTALLSVSPNPFNPRTVISYRLAESTDVELYVYSVAGQKVAAVVDRHMPAGTHSAVFDGAGLASGVYLYRFRAGTYVTTGRMLFVK